jgi:diguanylate cyclase (GGDEF)-like protein
MDIDHFKNFNDKYGHQTGDLVLQEVAKSLSESIRINDVPARYGGEEFAVILPETLPDQASIIGERIRKKIESLIINNGKQNLKVTVSIGCASIPDHAKNKQDIIKLADTAMYYSKKQGRNKFILYSRKLNINKQ